jgi:hypothetical protein
VEDVLSRGEDVVGMTDLQFSSYKELRDEREEELKCEINRLRAGNSIQDGSGVSNLQFLSYKEERDRRESAERKYERLCQLVKTYAEAGKSPQEMLAAINAFSTNEI